MRSGSNTIFAVLFLAVCSLPLVALVVPGIDAGGDLDEKRDLAPAPDLAGLPLAEIPAATEAWFNDHFGFRSLLVRMNGWWRYRVFNESSSPQVLPGRDGWLFYDGRGVRGGDPRRNHLAQLPAGHEKLFADLTDQFVHNAEWFAARGITYVVVIVPDKWSVYPDKLPASVGPPAGRTSGDLLLDRLRETDVRLIDLKEPLQAQREVAGPLYYRIDSHWNGLGAYLAAREIRDRLGEWVPGVAPLEPALPPLTPAQRTGGDLAALLGLEGWLRDDEPRIRLPETGNLEMTRLPPPPYGTTARRYPLEVVNRDPGAADRPRVLVMRDSYGDALWPWLGGGFSSSRWVWTSNVRRMNIGPLIDEYRPDIVIEEKAEKYLTFPIRFFTAPGRPAVVAPHGKRSR